MPGKRIKPLDFSNLSGGLARMLDRFVQEGTLTGEPEADRFLARHPAAVLLGLLYDQRVRAEYAFTGPIRLHERIGHLELPRIARMTEARLQRVFAEPPAVHRFTNKMADYTRDLARSVTEEYGGDARKLWARVDRKTVEQRVRALPGMGPAKAMKAPYVLHYLGYRDFA